MGERWRPVVGYEGTYEVSDQGRVRSHCRQGRLLRPGLASNGYYTVALGRGNSRTVHSLVAEAFIGPRPQGQEVLHKNGDRKDSRRGNLRYGTRAENNRQIVRDGRRKLDEFSIRYIKDELRAGRPGAHLARWLGVSESHISNIKHGRYYADV